jgi:hypothetical protein
VKCSAISGGDILRSILILNTDCVLLLCLLKCRPHYNLNLESIAVSGQKLPIDSSLFATSNTQGTIVDSGTTLVYLVDGAYDPFVNAVNPLLHTSSFFLWNSKYVTSLHYLNTRLLVLLICICR